MESSKIDNSNAMLLGKKFLAANFSAIIYYERGLFTHPFTLASDASSPLTDEVKPVY